MVCLVGLDDCWKLAGPEKFYGQVSLSPVRPGADCGLASARGITPVSVGKSEDHGPGAASPTRLDGLSSSGSVNDPVMVADGRRGGPGTSQSGPPTHVRCWAADGARGCHREGQMGPPGPNIFWSHGKTGARARWTPPRGSQPRKGRRASQSLQGPPSQ